MRTTIITLILGLLVLKGHSQTSEKQYVFDKNANVHSAEVTENVQRFKPSMNEINLADSLIEIHIKKNRTDYSWTKEISDYQSYYRQYVGYINEKNEKIIFVNGFCQAEQNWTKEIVSYRGGGSCYFDIKVNISAKSTFDFNVNAPK
jgi:hypothetical protein